MATAGDGPRPARTETFDNLAAAVFRQAIGDALDLCPEIRSVAVSIDYQGGLNDAPITKGLWLGRSLPGGPATEDPRVGPVVSADGIVGGAIATLRMLEMQLGRGSALTDQLRERLEVLGTEIVSRHENPRAEREEEGAGGAGAPGP